MKVHGTGSLYLHFGSRESSKHTALGAGQSAAHDFAMFRLSIRICMFSDGENLLVGICSRVTLRPR